MPDLASKPSDLRVVIAGGGVGGLETALALRAMAFDRVTIEIVAPERWFTYRALSVAEPAGESPAPRFDLQGIARKVGFRLRAGTVIASMRPRIDC